MGVKGSVIYRNFSGVNGSPNPLKKNIDYILNPKKASEENCKFILLDREQWERDIKTVLSNFVYEGIRPSSHGVISVRGTLDPTILLAKTAEIVTTIYGPTRQAVLAVHNNRKHLHCHFVVNNVDACSGMAYQASPKDRRNIREMVNNVFSAIGFPLKGSPKLNKYQQEQNAITSIIENRNVFKEPSYNQPLVSRTYAKTKKQEDEIDDEEFYRREMERRKNNPQVQLTNRSALLNFAPSYKVSSKVKKEVVNMPDKDENVDKGFNDASIAQSYASGTSSNFPTYTDENGSFVNVNIRLPVPKTVNEFTPYHKFAVGTVLIGGVLLNKLLNGDYGDDGGALLENIVERDLPKYVKSCYSRKDEKNE